MRVQSQTQRAPGQTFEPTRADKSRQQGGDEQYQAKDKIFCESAQVTTGRQAQTNRIANAHQRAQYKEQGDVDEYEDKYSPTAAQAASAVKEDLFQVHGAQNRQFGERADSRLTSANGHPSL